MSAPEAGRTLDERMVLYIEALGADGVHALLVRQGEEAPDLPARGVITDTLIESILGMAVARRKAGTSALEASAEAVLEALCLGYRMGIEDAAARAALGREIMGPPCGMQEPAEPQAEGPADRMETD